MNKMKTLNRVYHPWWNWECYKCGFYNGFASDTDKLGSVKQYELFLSDLKRFEKGIRKVFKMWPNSCEHFLSNPNINRIAWIGQAAMCIETGVPSCFRGGYKQMSKKKQDAADKLAKRYLDKWTRERR